MNESLLKQEFSLNEEFKKFLPLILLDFVILGIGLFSLFGGLLSIPWFYTWQSHGIVINIKTVIGFILLSLGYSYHFLPKSSFKKGFFFLSILCFLTALGIGIEGLLTFALASGKLSVIDFFQLSSPTGSRVPLYADIGFIIASIVSLMTLFVRTTPRAGLWVILAGGFFLLNMGVFGVLETILGISIFRFLISLPGGICLTLYSLILLSYPYQVMELKRVLSSSRIVRYYALFLAFIWVMSLSWQILNGFLIPPQPVILLESERGFNVYDDIFGMIFTSIVMILSLHVLEKLGKNELLTEEIQKTFYNYSVLAATISHDLKAPIQNEIMAIDMLKKGSFGEKLSDDKNQRILSSIRENNYFELELVLNLIDLLRYEMKEEQYNPQPIELNVFFQQLQDEVAPYVLARKLSMTIPKNLTQMLMADLSGLKRVFHNLINNAVQHMEGGTEITLHAELEENRYLFKVQDNGMGISPEVLNKLFQPFMHEGEKQKPISGSGLGLYISKKIIQKHQGEIWVESYRDGRGTTIFFTIPLSSLQPLKTLSTHQYS